MPIYHAVSAVQGVDCREGTIDYGYFEGSREDVLAYVRTLPNWKNYNDEGYISEVIPKQIDRDSVPRRKALLEIQAELKQKLAEIEKQL